MEPARSLKPARSGRALPGDLLVFFSFFFLLFLSMFSRLWFDWARLDDDIWGVGGSPSRSSAGRSRRSRICTAAAATPAAILDTEVEPHETLVRTSSSADRSGTHTSKKSAYITVSFTVLCPGCVCVCHHRCIDLYTCHGWRFICSMAHNMDPDVPSPFYLQDAKPVWFGGSVWHAAGCPRVLDAPRGQETDTVSHRTNSLQISILSNTLFLNRGVVAHMNGRGEKNSQKDKYMKMKCLQTKHIKGVFTLSLAQGPY